jgi:hypothetical protein
MQLACEPTVGGLWIVDQQPVHFLVERNCLFVLCNEIGRIDLNQSLLVPVDHVGQVTGW